MGPLALPCLAPLQVRDIVAEEVPQVYALYAARIGEHDAGKLSEEEKELEPFPAGVLWLLKYFYSPRGAHRCPCCTCGVGFGVLRNGDAPGQ